jgi:hypothetical protein
MSSTERCLSAARVEVLERVRRLRRLRRMAGEREALAAPGDGDVVGGLDLAQVLVEHAAQVGRRWLSTGEKDFQGFRSFRIRG